MGLIATRGVGQLKNLDHCAAEAALDTASPSPQVHHTPLHLQQGRKRYRGKEGTELLWQNW